VTFVSFSQSRGVEMALGGPGVQVAWPSILRRLLRNGGDEIYLLFHRGDEERRDLATAMDAAEAAMRHANTAVPEESTSAESVEPSPYGPVIVLDLPGTEDDFQAWLAAFSGHLTQEGWTGAIGPSPEELLPTALDATRSTPKLTAFLGLRMSDPPPRGKVVPWVPPRWGVDHDTTETLCRDMIVWAQFPEAELYLQQGRSHTKFTGPDATEPLIWAAHHDRGSGVTFVREDPLMVRRAYHRSEGQVVYQIEDQHHDWRARVEDLRQTMTQHPDQLDLAFIRLIPRRAQSWGDLDSKHPPLPFVIATAVRLNRHLWDRYVPDAHGIQILTDAHVARAGNLDHWDVDELTPGRYLVQAKDLQPWYSGTDPDPETLTAARHDFADMILTPAAIAATA
jgi:hypothetical protein